MIAGPSSPGVGAPVYQPAGKPTGGTSIVPSAFNPSAISLESTPIAGICRRTGVDFDKCAAWTAGVATSLGATARGTTTLGATLVGVPIDGAGAAPGSLEQPTVPTAIIATRAAAATATRERVSHRRGLSTLWLLSFGPLRVQATTTGGYDCRATEPGERQSTSHDIRQVGDGSAGTAVTGGNRSGRRGRDLGRGSRRGRGGRRAHHVHADSHAPGHGHAVRSGFHR